MFPGMKITFRFIRLQKVFSIKTLNIEMYVCITIYGKVQNKNDDIKKKNTFVQTSSFCLLLYHHVFFEGPE